MLKKILIFFVAFCLIQPIHSQISFTEDEINLTELSVSSGAPMAVSDMNGDGLDDIISLDDTRRLFISFQNQDGSYNVVDYPNVGNSNWGMTVGDFNNDSRSEIFTGGAYNDVYVVGYNDDGTISTSFLDGPSIFVQAVALFDIDNDGFLDAVACHDDGPNAVYMNDGNGELSYMNGDVPFEKFGSQEDNSGNYGNVWADVNGDGLMDYYIAKCRQGVTSQTDVRRINQLWINNGDGTFTESARQYGLDIGLQSWTAEFQDIDNDGDLDCLVTNHDGPSQILRNVDNLYYEDITTSSGIDVGGIPIQGIMRDFDNDGYMDVLITGNEAYYYQNNGDTTFTRIFNEDLNFLGGENSFASGDMNHDGFVDLMIGYGVGFNSPTSRLDKLWINNTNDNHWLGVELEGTVSNLGGIGSRIEIYGEWGMMIREVRAGESYGISHSLTQHFGLGSAMDIDSIVVHWPSGVTDSYTDLEIDQFVKLKEDACITPPSTVVADGPLVFCSGENVTLTAPAGYQYLWSNGSADQNITVATSGVFNVEIIDGSSCSTRSLNIEVVVDPDESFDVVSDASLVICEGESVVLENSLAEAVNWSNNSTSESITVSEAGLYFAFAEGTCGPVLSDTVEVEIIPTPAEPSNFDYEYSNFGEITLSADGNAISWYADENGSQFLGNGNEIVLSDIFANTTIYAQSASDGSNEVFNGGESAHTGSSDYNSDGFNGAMNFDVLEPIILRSVNVETDLPGERTIELVNNSNYSFDVIASLTIDVPAGRTKLDLNFNIEEPGQYFLTTNSQSNFENFGYESPRLKRSAVDFGSILSYPYTVGNILFINTSNFGDRFYYYFYDWEISKPSTGCLSEIVPVELIASSTSELEKNDALSLQPNPSAGVFNLSYSENGAYDISVSSIDGQEIISARSKSADYPIDLSNYSSGIYILKVYIGGDTYYSKLVKM